MGHRFQVFVVARISCSPGVGRHTCVAAYHHQWCFETLPLRALHRFLTLLRQPENAAVVRDELWVVDQKALGLVKMGPAVNEDPAVPCPYLASLLAISWSTDLSENQSYISGHSLRNGLLDVRDDCWKKTRQSLNDEGIAIVDLSSLDAPAYCFIPDDQSPVMTAYEYIRYKMYCGSFTEVPCDVQLPAVDPEDDWIGEPEGSGEWKPEESSGSGASKHHQYVTLLDVFWALVDLAGYRLVPAEVVNGVWPDQPTHDKHMVGARAGRQLKVPLREDTPMPLDVVTSLYLGLAMRQELESLRHAFGQEDEPHIAIGKAVLPPYEIASNEQRSARMSVIYQMLREERAFQFVFEPEWPIDDQGVPSYCRMAFVDKLMHWNIEMVRRTGGIWPLRPGQTTLSAHAQATIAQAQNELQSLLRPSEVSRLTLCLARTIGDPQLMMLDHVMQNLERRTFVDLAFMPLTAQQIIRTMRGFPEVEALSLSHNRRILADDIPVIIAALPSLKRLHIMGFCPSLDFDRLRDLLFTQPLVFRSLESLLTPELISLLPTDCPAAFVFQHITRASGGPLPGISLPFFVPEQIIRTLNEVFPLALRESHYGDSLHMLGKKWDFSLLKTLRYGPLNVGHTKPADGTPFYMNVAMLLHACLSCGIPAPGTAWCKRPIVSLPIQYTSYSRGPQGTWGFIFDWDHTRHRHADRGTNAYAFVYYERVFPHDSILNCACSSVKWLHEFLLHEQTQQHGTHATGSQGESPATNLLNEALPGIYHFVRTAYDLHGFLRCMADEGRPLPSPEVVQILDDNLNMRDPATMERICRLMSSDELPHVSSASSQCEHLETLQKFSMFPDFEPIGQQPPRLWTARMMLSAQAEEKGLPIPVMVMY
ncbi:hypothetical protein OH77DRAFT_1056945 [Trametes cingulata]|nr:hypothetical protein OH77DRAFT_1056945 [Trametes cingulata]